MTVALLVLLAVLMDWLLGEPRRWHPLIGFGWLTKKVEHFFYGMSDIHPLARKLRGILAVLFLILPLVVVAALLVTLPDVGMLFSLLILYFSLGHKSLHEHAEPVASALHDDNDAEARRLVSQLVSRDAATLNISSSAVESVLENGNDGVFGALFWFVVAGGAGALFYRLANTLDAMWGYRNERYQHFGWAAARLDDVLNFFPARLTALTYALLGQTRKALDCWKQQPQHWDSPNAGPVMAAGAGALAVKIGGPACYQGKWHMRPFLGVGVESSSADITRALKLVRHGVWLWIAILLVVGVITNA